MQSSAYFIDSIIGLYYCQTKKFTDKKVGHLGTEVNVTHDNKIS